MQLCQPAVFSWLLVYNTAQATYDAGYGRAAIFAHCETLLSLICLKKHAEPTIDLIYMLDAAAKSLSLVSMGTNQPGVTPS